VSIDDRILIERSLAGQTDAFGMLVDRYQDRLYGTLAQMLRSPHDALDVAQEAFVLAHQNLNTFRGDAAFYSWLFRIAYNAAISFRRKNKRNHASIDQYREQTGTDPTDQNESSDPTQPLISLERQQAVRDALDQLPEDQRTVLVLKEMEGLRYDEISEIIGCPIGTVRSRIHRARSELKEILTRTIKSN